ncbi:hypothetical protein LSH36_34g03074 [Paralvinella palmiformis]|uniref:alkaline phosphatase n=1 Tax=Paralvinella palmiformis TaxID=53620 RepID=A0AAD9KA38_9ANNE|nr:hypothetical protein LSH36_34g03074 [Paralvinella palmiformis]
MELPSLWFVCLLVLCDRGNGRHLTDDADEERPYHHPRITIDRTREDDVINGVNWTQRAQDELYETLNVRQLVHPAKNVILFIGDGMGISTQTPTRFLKAQLAGKLITDTSLSWERFDASGLIKTYNVDQQTPDSAGTASAFMTGEKTRAGVISVNQNVRRGDCLNSKGNEAKSLLQYSMERGKLTGVITTARITHATPSCAYAHSADRDWENDAELLEVENGDLCHDIGWQLVHGAGNDQIRVILGGGRRNMMPNDTADPEYPLKYGERLDGHDLREDWVEIQKSKGLTDNQYKYVENLTAFNAVNPTEVEYLMGLFEHDHMKYEMMRADDPWGEPSLADMVRKSIDILKKGMDGFFLYVEGARIDHAHHDNKAYHALHDTLALEEAVQAAADMTDENDTLLVLTADHSHTFSMAGYPRISNDIFGKVENINGEIVMAGDDKPYLTLGYVNGPGFLIHRTQNLSLDTEIPRKNLTDQVTNGNLYLQDAGVPLLSETHGGEDVAIYARGPMSHLFIGLHEQHYIAHAIGYASCVGWNTELCGDISKVSSATIPQIGLILLLSYVMAAIFLRG